MSSQDKMLTATLLLTFVVSVLAGTQCPPREDIYPCSCLAVPQGKKIFFTSVTCHRLPSTDSLSSIFPSLRKMAIDHFYLYDSFWEANKLGTSEGENKQVLPSDWLTLLKVKEMEIVDTTLSPCFACQARITCRNDVTVRFTAVNSSSHEKICTLCEGSGSSKYSWTACMSKLREFHFRHGKLTTVRADLFPQKMTKLTEVDLSYNQITKIESRAFMNLPKLKILILSHNALESLVGLFANVKMTELEQLDVSWNLLKMLNADIFSSVPVLKTLIANNNNIMELIEKEWKNSPQTLRTIDIEENPIHCDCGIRWINGTFHINTVILGHCATPEDYENSQIRRASRMLVERCSDEGEIGTRSRSNPQKAVTQPMFT